MTNSDYVAGAMVLGQTLRESHAKHDLVVMVTDGVTSSDR